jgi:ribonuclease P protein component
MHYSFSKKEKLKSKKRIAQLFEEGKALTVYPLKLIYSEVNEQPSKIQAGVSVPKKNFKSAVTRNRIKRLLRESYRLNKAIVFNNTQGEFAFLFLYLGKETPTFLEVQGKMKALLKKFNDRVHEKTS